MSPLFPDDSDNDPTFNPEANAPNESSDENVETRLRTSAVKS